MLNDATAIVLFDLVLAAVAAREFGVDTVEQASVNIFVVLGGGLLVGAVIATIMGYSIAQARHNPLIQMTVTIVVAYASFIAADHFFHVSGVIAVMMSGSGGRSLCGSTPESRSASLPARVLGICRLHRQQPDLFAGGHYHRRVYL
jgi:NhaP-type Na+/H+ or K+/H+ antiporter